MALADRFAYPPEALSISRNIRAVRASMDPRTPLYLFVLRASSRDQPIPAHRDLL